MLAPGMDCGVGGGGSGGGDGGRPSRYESQKRRDWNTFGQYLRNHRPPLALSRCSGAHVLEFLRYLDQFGKTKVHSGGCPFFGHPNPPAPCPCPLRQAWGSLDALVGRLRAAFEENGGQPEANPFGTRAVRLYLREVRDSQAKARGIAYEKKKRKKPSATSASTANAASAPPQPMMMMTANSCDVNSSANSSSGSSSRDLVGVQFGNLIAPGGENGDEMVMAVVESHNGGFLPLSVFN
ncbi:putative protein G1-like2 [Iris pallida]|uniref:ALOG domain-containing protein n=1 Tax=Iris pallida TaxID=29817 RepID=A0AAX6FRX5_IRIPA|nr:putative protein G1-like2 [Iris pallida]KAJ6819152.1 putative protein G1-like2 [Iris pallida]